MVPWWWRFLRPWTWVRIGLGCFAIFLITWPLSQLFIEARMDWPATLKVVIGLVVLWSIGRE